MRIPLTNEQRNFLIYLRDKHDGYGYEGTIANVLENDFYDDGSSQAYLNMIANEFKKERYDPIYFNSYGGAPTKYLK